MPPEGHWLLVEDDAVDAMTVRRALGSLDRSVVFSTSRNATEARSFLAACLLPETREPRPSLVLLDLDLPSSSGLELLVDLKCDPNWRSVPVVVLTGSESEKDTRRAYERGAAGYFLKPAGFGDFLAVVDAIFRYWTLSSAPPARASFGAGLGDSHPELPAIGRKASHG